MGQRDQKNRHLIADTKALEEAGAFSIVLECVPAPLSKLISEKVNIPTIGNGAGVHGDGQVHVVSDLIGLFADFVPKHAKQYAKLGEEIRAAVAKYISEVKSEAFPTAKESFAMDESIPPAYKTDLEAIHTSAIPAKTGIQ